MKINNFILAATTLIGTIIGVGMFGLPYVASVTGIFPVIVYLVLLGAFVLLLHLMYGEVVLRTNQKHRLTGYAEMYLGKFGKTIAAIAFFFGLYGALLAYLVIGGNFLATILSAIFGSFSIFWASIIVLVLAFLIVARGINNIGVLEIVMSAVLISLIVGVYIYGAEAMTFNNLLSKQGGNILLPYGVVMFSLWGTAAIPEIRRFFAKKPKLLLRSITIGTILPILIYILFTIAVVAISGGATTQDAINGLVPILGIPFSVYGASVGFLAVITSFIVIAATIKNSYVLDLGVPKIFSILLAFVVPLGFFLIGARNFIEIIDWVGAILVGTEGILLLFLHKSAQKKGQRQPEYALLVASPLRWALVVVLFLAVVSRFV